MKSGEESPIERRMRGFRSSAPATAPGGRGGYDINDEVFFNSKSGPQAGRVVCHGVHGCTVDDASGKRHQVTWDQVLGLKNRKTYPARVVERGSGGGILEREDGTRFYCRGQLPAAPEPGEVMELGEWGGEMRKAVEVMKEECNIMQASMYNLPVVFFYNLNEPFAKSTRVVQRWIPGYTRDNGETVAGHFRMVHEVDDEENQHSQDVPNEKSTSARLVIEDGDEVHIVGGDKSADIYEALKEQYIKGLKYLPLGEKKFNLTDKGIFARYYKTRNKYIDTWPKYEDAISGLEILARGGFQGEIVRIRGPLAVSDSVFAVRYTGIGDGNKIIQNIKSNKKAAERAAPTMDEPNVIFLPPGWIGLHGGDASEEDKKNDRRPKSGDVYREPCWLGEGIYEGIEIKRQVGYGNEDRYEPTYFGLSVEGYYNTKEKAIEAAKMYARSHSDDDKFYYDRDKLDREIKNAIAKRLLNGEKPTEEDIKMLDLYAGISGTSGLKWFIPNVADLFGISSRKIRPFIKDLIRKGDIYEYVPTVKGLMAVAQGLKPKDPELFKAQAAVDAYSFALASAARRLESFWTMLGGEDVH